MRLKKMIQVKEKPSLDANETAIIKSFIATTPRYQGYPVLSFAQITGLILAREAWGGPFPSIVF